MLGAATQASAKRSRLDSFFTNRKSIGSNQENSSEFWKSSSGFHHFPEASEEIEIIKKANTSTNTKKRLHQEVEDPVSLSGNTSPNILIENTSNNAISKENNNKDIDMTTGDLEDSTALRRNSNKKSPPPTSESDFPSPNTRRRRLSEENLGQQGSLPPPPPLQAHGMPEPTGPGGVLPPGSRTDTLSPLLSGKFGGAGGLLNPFRKDSPGIGGRDVTSTTPSSAASAGGGLFPPGLQQMQQLLASGCFNPSQIHHFMQQQQQLAETGRKQLEQCLHQIQEQLQINLLQQTQLMQNQGDKSSSPQTAGGGGKSSPSLQQLQIQQQQLISQLQLLQQRLLMFPQFGNNNNNNDKFGKENGSSDLTSPNSSSSPKPFNNNKSNNNKGESKSSCPSSPASSSTAPLLSPRANINNTDGDNGNENNNNINEKSQPTTQHPLYSHGTCKWTGCETSVDDFPGFLNHITAEHVLDDKSTAQARVQMQIVSQLELQLQKEKERLQAMMTHLHLSKEADLKAIINKDKANNNNGDLATPPSDLSSQTNKKNGRMSESPSRSLKGDHNPEDRPKSPPAKMLKFGPFNHPPHGLPPHSAAAAAAAAAAVAALGAGLHGSGGPGSGPAGAGPTGPLFPPMSTSLPGVLPPLSALTAAVRNPMVNGGPPPGAPGIPPPGVNGGLIPPGGIPHPPPPGIPGLGGPMRRRLTDKLPHHHHHIPIPNGMPYMLDRTGLDIAQEIYRNREFYRTQDVRPPFTYASLIRQAIIESPDRQLTLHEIYNWFTNTFAYFRRSAASWKNAIRTNLSLHKCFVRYEDDFGSFWMVDDAEFMKRRHLSRGRPRKYEPGAPGSGSRGNSPVTNANSPNPNRPSSSGSAEKGGPPGVKFPGPMPLPPPGLNPVNRGGGIPVMINRDETGRNMTGSQNKSPPFPAPGGPFNEALQNALGFGRPGSGPPGSAGSPSAGGPLGSPPGAPDAALPFLNQALQHHRDRDNEKHSLLAHQNLGERSASFDSYAKHLRNNFFSSLAAAGGPGGALTNPLLMAAAQAHKFGPMNPDTGELGRFLKRMREEGGLDPATGGVRGAPSADGNQDPDEVGASPPRRNSNDDDGVRVGEDVIDEDEDDIREHVAVEMEDDDNIAEAEGVIPAASAENPEESEEFVSTSKDSSVNEIQDSEDSSNKGRDLRKRK